ncbi:MAG: arylsulfatase [Gemmatimonadota bacterium]|nr:arylsulfatase [Gemmatimonadota bacterium]
MNGKKNIDRREFITRCVPPVIATGALLGSSLSCAGKQRAARKPNIIFIMADDLGYGDLGCYGQREIRTPNLDALAAAGMRFTDHYAGSTVCAPSRCCLMTGLHTGHAWIRGNREAKPMGQEPLPEGTVTVAGLLKQAGYTTGLIGKWGLGGPGSEGTPNKQGFDYFFGYLCQRHAHNSYPEFLFRNDERVPLEGNRLPEPKRPDGAGVAEEKVRHSHDLFTTEALGFIERNRDRPFFLYLPYTIPHANNEAGDQGMEVPTDAPYTGRDWPQQQKNHAAMITRLDSDVGRIMAQLKKLGINEDTVVVFTSDNGPHREGGADPEFFDSNGPLRGIKRDLYEGGIRVPMIARWPGHIAPGTVSDHVSAFWDFLPTAAGIAGLDVPAGSDGLSFLPTLLGTPGQCGHEYLYWEFHYSGSRASKQAVRFGQWKAVRLSPSATIELYDLETDLGEQCDVAGAHPEIVARAGEMIEAARVDSELFLLSG